MAKFVWSCPSWCSCARLSGEWVWHCGDQDMTEKQLGLITNDSDITVVGVLYLNNNKLTSFPSKVFENFTNLQSLYLDGNSIDSIPELLDVYLPKLTFLSISSNRVADIGVNSFSANSSLEEVRIAHNGIETIPPQTFSNLKLLKKLSVNNNKINSLSKGSLDGVDLLESLDASNNNIGEIGNGTFHGVKHLTTLNLSGNKFLRITEKIFSSLLKIKHLDFSNNSIGMIEIDAFKGINLTSLNLAGNNLKQLQANSFVDATISELQLDRNPLTCGCHLKSVYNTLYGNSTVSKQKHLTGACMRPDAVTGKSIEDVINNLDCGNDCKKNNLCLNDGECVMYANADGSSTNYYYGCKCSSDFQGVVCGEKVKNSKKIILVVIVVLVIVIIGVLVIVALLWLRRKRNRPHKLDREVLTDVDDFAI